MIEGYDESRESKHANFSELHTSLISTSQRRSQGYLYSLFILCHICMHGFVHSSTAKTTALEFGLCILFFEISSESGGFASAWSSSIMKVADCDALIWQQTLSHSISLWRTSQGETIDGCLELPYCSCFTFAGAGGGAYTVSINVRNRCQEIKFVFYNLRNLMRKFMFSFMSSSSPPPPQTNWWQVGSSPS